MWFQILGISLLLGQCLADLSSADPVCGNCFCAQVSSQLDVSDGPDGLSLGKINNGDCLRHTGQKKRVDNRSWYSADYQGNPNGWVPGEALVQGADDSCQSTKGSDMPAAENVCMCVTKHALSAHGLPHVSSQIHAVIQEGECHLTTGHENQGQEFKWIQIKRDGKSLWSDGTYLAVGCPSQCTNDTCSEYKLDRREVWGAAVPTPGQGAVNAPLDHVYIHQTSGHSCNHGSDCSLVVKEIQSKHMGDYGWGDIAYNFLIGGDGTVYEGRGWGSVQGACNMEVQIPLGLHLAFIGDFSSQAPSSAAISAANNLIACGVHKKHLIADYNLAGFRDFECTENPGVALYTEIQTWPNFLSIPPPPRKCW